MPQSIRQSRRVLVPAGAELRSVSAVMFAVDEGAALRGIASSSGTRLDQKYECQQA